MAYKCPRCDKVMPSRFAIDMRSKDQLLALKVLFRAAFCAPKCQTCGKLRRSEFPPAVRFRLILGRLLAIIIVAMFILGLFVMLGLYLELKRAW